MSQNTKIEKTSHYLSKLFKIIFFLTPIAYALPWLLFNSTNHDIFGIVLPIKDITHISATQAALGIIISIIPAALTMYTMKQLIKLFDLYNNSIIFSEQNIKCYKNLGIVLLLWIFADLICDALYSLALTYSNPVGQRMINLGVSDDDITRLIIGTIVLVIAWVMQEAHALQNEAKYTI